MSEKLRFFDPQLKEKPEQELFNEPEWLMELRQLDGQIRVRREREKHLVWFFLIFFFFLITFSFCKFRSYHLFSFINVFYPAVIRQGSFSTMRTGQLLHSLAPAAPVLTWTSKVHLNRTPSLQNMMAPHLIIH